MLQTCSGALLCRSRQRVGRWYCCVALSGLGSMGNLFSLGVAQGYAALALRAECLCLVWVVVGYLGYSRWVAGTAGTAGTAGPTRSFPWSDVGMHTVPLCGTRETEQECDSEYDTVFPASPFQGLVFLVMCVPRALPWAMLRWPFGPNACVWFGWWLGVLGYSRWVAGTSGTSGTTGEGDLLSLPSLLSLKSARHPSFLRGAQFLFNCLPPG